MVDDSEPANIQSRNLRKFSEYDFATESHQQSLCVAFVFGQEECCDWLEDCLSGVLAVCRGTLWGGTRGLFIVELASQIFTVKVLFQMDSTAE
ncbi:hypothetical protein GCM10009123_16530 [Kangiella japonica]|uniref:Uncharacterized protein n=1 Tax=Kangiella japonica TaxID=647384 RepID=A0ABP3CN66_9GAMM